MESSSTTEPEVARSVPPTPSDLQIFGRNVREFRNHLHMTQQAFANRAKISLNLLQQLEAESCEPNPTWDKIQRIAVALDVRIFDLLNPNFNPKTYKAKTHFA